MQKTFVAIGALRVKGIQLCLLVGFQTDYRRVHENISAAIQREEERHGESRRQAAVSPKYTPVVPSSTALQVNTINP